VTFFVDAVSNSLCLVFEHCEGGNLAAFLRQRKQRGLQIEEPLLVSWAVQLLQAIQHLGKHGLVHQRIGLRNVMLSGGADLKQIKLADLLVGSRNLSDVRLSDAATASVAPECRDGDAPSAASDIWALGVLILRLMTLADHQVKSLVPPGPFGAETESRLHAEIRALCQKHRYSNQLERALIGMLTLEPDHRFSAETALKQLTSSLSNRRRSDAGLPFFAPCCCA
jgi:serine/threonine protein kinase